MLFIDAANAGVSGDMMIAGLLDLGADIKGIDSALKPIIEVIGDYRIEDKTVCRGVYQARYYRFNFEDRHISYRDARKAVEGAQLSARARQFALSCFDTLAAAESRVHGIPVEELHLHDVPDTIADFVSAAALLEDLEVYDTQVISSAVNTGRGFFKFHGQRSTLPAPATAEILKGKPLFGDVDLELTTPTGASILVNLASDFTGDFPRMKIQRIGYGAGYHDLDFPNVLKLYLGEDPGRGTLRGESLSLLETNVDTATGEELGYLFERLQDAGALDVTVIPCIMKKNRPGHIIQVMSNPLDIDRLASTLMKETGTLGVRVTPDVHRHVLERRVEKRRITLAGKDFTVQYKIATDRKGNTVSEKPEFEDLKRIVKETGMSLREVKKQLKEVDPN